MTNTSINNTAVNLDGLLEVLGKNLYSSPNVAVRELIQNAVDACQRHRLETQDGEDYFVRLTCRPDQQQLIIEDNGSGLTLEEVKQFLATIGSGYSRLLRHETGSEDIVGYFGLGFLTAYIVSSKVQVTTTSYQTPDQSWQFTSSKGKTYAIAPCERITDRGTRVVLQLEEDYNNLASASFLRSVIEKYCCLLQVPIFINEECEPVNDLQAPWYRDSDMSPLRRAKLDLEFANIFETTFEPIAVFTIPDNPHQVKGLLWVQGSSTYASSDNRNLSLFTRNMFITDEDKELLPRWAGFCGGVLESSQFKPTASRESLQRDSYYRDVSAFLQAFLVGELSRVVTEEPATWRRIISRHGQALLGAAITDDGFFAASYKTLKIPTTDGEMTIPELLKRGDGSIYIKPSSEAGHEEVLFRARGNPLVKGYLFGATGFCQKYQAWQGGQIFMLGSEDSRKNVFPTHSPDAKLETVFKDLFENDQYAVAFTRFEPDHIPLIVMEERDIVTKNRIEADEADRRISTAALSLARLTTTEESKTQERTIFVNLGNGLVNKLPNLSGDKRANLATLMKSLMEVLCLDSAQLEAGFDGVFSDFNKAMLSMFEGET